MSDRLLNVIDRHVASRLRLRPLEASLSQTTLAVALGISFQQLQKYEGRAALWAGLALDRPFLRCFTFDHFEGSEKARTLYSA
jgi:transcriptional regulator with XRE-family HTH domain